MLPYAYHLTTHPFLFLSGCYVLLISSEIVRKMLLIEIHFFCEFALERRRWSFAHSDEGLTAQMALRTVCECLLGVDTGGLWSQWSTYQASGSCQSLPGNYHALLQKPGS